MRCHGRCHCYKALICKGCGITNDTYDTYDTYDSIFKENNDHCNNVTVVVILYRNGCHGVTGVIHYSILFVFFFNNQRVSRYDT